MVACPRNHLYRTTIRRRNGRPLRAGGFVVGAEIDHGGYLADELDLEALLSGMQHDTLDEAAEDLQRLGLRLWVGDGRLQVSDLAPIDLGEVRMEPRRRGR